MPRYPVGQVRQFPDGQASAHAVGQASPYPFGQVPQSALPPRFQLAQPSDPMSQPQPVIVPSGIPVAHAQPTAQPKQSLLHPLPVPGRQLPAEPVRLVRRPNAWWYSVGQVFFFLYIAAIGLLTLIPNLDQTAVPNLALRAVNWLARHGINLTISQLEQIANFLMFIPFGILGSLLLAHRLTPRMRLVSVRGYGEKTLRKGLRIGRAAFIICLFAALYSVGIETLQNMIPGRVSDPRDILLNSGGAVVGAMIVTAVIWFFQFLGWTLRVGGSDG